MTRELQRARRSNATTGRVGSCAAGPASAARGGVGPVRPGEAPPQLGVRGDIRPGRRPATMAAPMRVLMIEDEVPLAEAVGRGLKREGYSVDYAHDGLTGLERARDGAYDAIILDILLPKMNGYKVCETL